MLTSVSTAKQKLQRQKDTWNALLAPLPSIALFRANLKEESLSWLQTCLSECLWFAVRLYLKQFFQSERGMRTLFINSKGLRNLTYAPLGQLNSCDYVSAPELSPTLAGFRIFKKWFHIKETAEERQQMWQLWDCFLHYLVILVACLFCVCTCVSFAILIKMKTRLYSNMN